jgi:hypothetical protein
MGAAGSMDARNPEVRGTCHDPEPVTMYRGRALIRIPVISGGQAIGWQEIKVSCSDLRVHATREQAEACGAKASRHRGPPPQGAAGDQRRTAPGAGWRPHRDAAPLGWPQPHGR